MESPAATEVWLLLCLQPGLAFRPDCVLCSATTPLPNMMGEINVTASGQLLVDGKDDNVVDTFIIALTRIATETSWNSPIES